MSLIVIHFKEIFMNRPFLRSPYLPVAVSPYNYWPDLGETYKICALRMMKEFDDRCCN